MVLYNILHDAACAVFCGHGLFGVPPMVIWSCPVTRARKESTLEWPANSVRLRCSCFVLLAILHHTDLLYPRVDGSIRRPFLLQVLYPSYCAEVLTNPGPRQQEQIAPGFRSGVFHWGSLPPKTHECADHMQLRMVLN
jgi:hypothetical protein